MPSTTGRLAGKWPSVVNLLAGIWLLLAPAVLGYGVAAAVWNDRVVGLAVAVLALLRLIAPSRLEILSWLNFLLGAWLVIAPFLLVYSAAEQMGVGPGHGPATANDIIVGLVVLAMAAWSAISGSGVRGAHDTHVGVSTAEQTRASARSNER